MIKKNGDWTSKFINKLYEAKKQILKSDSIKIDGVEQNEIFNVMLEFDGNIQISEHWKFYYPTVHISRPITAAAESAAYKKYFVMIGAGSGIAPYLSFLED